MLRKSLLLVALTLCVPAVYAPNQADALWLKDAVRRVGRTLKDTGRRVGTKIVDTGKKVGTKIVDTGKKVGSAIANTAKSAFSAVKAFGQSFVDNIKSLAKKAWSKTLSVAKGVADKVKSAISSLSAAALKALLGKYYKKIEAGLDKAKDMVAGPYKKFQALLKDNSMKALVKRVLEKAAKKQLDRALMADAKKLAKYFGVLPKTACAPTRRKGQAPCDAAIGAFSLGVGAGVTAIGGFEVQIGVAFGKDGMGVFAGWGWSLGAKADVGADIILGLYPSVTSIGGQGVGGTIGGKYVGGGSFGIDWPSENWVGKNPFPYLKALGREGASYSVAGGVGIGGGLALTWSSTALGAINWAFQEMK